MTDEDYLETIDRKTASLFAAAGQASAILADATPEYEQALASYGSNIGMAFQIIDDLLDYSADTARFGKKVGADLREGKMTLPAIYLLRDGEKAAQEHFLGCFGDPELSDDDLSAVVMAVRACGARDASYMAAAKYAHLAEDSL